MDQDKDVERIAQQYRDEGFLVLTHPDSDHLPEFAISFGIDLLATRGDEHVLVQIKNNRAELEADSNAPVQAEVINSHPGWRYDLVILNEDDPLRRLARGSREPSDEEIDKAISESESLIQSGHVASALVMAWATFEAAMRRVTSDLELYMTKTIPRELLRTLYGNGLLSRDEFDRLNSSFRSRTEIVHGLIPPAIEVEQVYAIIRATRRLLTDNPDASNVQDIR